MPEEKENQREQKELEQTRPEPDRRAEPPAERHRTTGEPPRGITEDQYEAELRGEAAQRLKERQRLEREKERVRRGNGDTNRN